MGKTYKIREGRRRKRRTATEERKRGIVSEAWKRVAAGKMTVAEYDELRRSLGEV